MTPEEKQLLLKDLCARLPYGVKIMFSHNGFRWDWEQTLDEIRLCEDGEWAINGWGIHGIKPYLRPMSSMTKEEREELSKLSTDKILKAFDGEQGYNPGTMAYNSVCVDYCLSHHLDYRGMIPMGLALEAPEGMYKTE